MGSGPTGVVFLDIQFSKGPAVEKSAAAVVYFDASGRGVFSIGISDGKVAVETDDAETRRSAGSPIERRRRRWRGLTKGYPATLSPKSVNGVRGRRSTSRGNRPLRSAWFWKLKGSAMSSGCVGALFVGWSTVQATIDWAVDRDFKEAVFVLSPAGAPPGLRGLDSIGAFGPGQTPGRRHHHAFDAPVRGFSTSVPRRRSDHRSTTKWASDGRGLILSSLQRRCGLVGPKRVPAALERHDRQRWAASVKGSDALAS